MHTKWRRRNDGATALTHDSSTACPGAHELPVRGLRAGVPFAARDWVAEEVPVALEFNGVSHAVMLASPLNLEDFALGFALSEGILSSAGELYDVEETSSALGITLHLRVATSAFEKLKDRRRSLTGRTGCGLCGIDSLQQVVRSVPVLTHPTVVTPTAIAKGMAQMAQQQQLQQATGAVHAAAWCTAEGEVRLLREDVGRHNALDKLVGALARQHVAAADGFVTITSRASFEMVHKAAAAGVPLLAAVSAPTTLAVDTAQRLGVGLVGFARQRDLVIYAQPHHWRFDDSTTPEPIMEAAHAR
jgi:FdhD protein